jgi:hypothetical protein
MSKLPVPDPELPEKLRRIEQEYIAGVDDVLGPFLKDYRDLVGADAPEDIRTRNLDAILRIHHAELAGASTEVLYETFAELVWPLHDELERRAGVVEKASATTKEELQRAAGQIRSHRKARLATGRTLPGDENLAETTEAVEGMITRAQVALKQSANQRRLLHKTRSAVRRIRRARLVWRVIEIITIVAGGLAVEKINERIKEQVLELTGPDSTSAALVVVMTWLVAAAFVIWFHHEVVNEWMKRTIDNRHRDELMSDIMDYLTHRVSLEYNLGSWEYLFGVAAPAKSGPRAMGSSEPLRPKSDKGS